jgi:hypothetical protein
MGNVIEVRAASVFCATVARHATLQVSLQACHSGREEQRQGSSRVNFSATVVSVHSPVKATASNPIVIELEASIDNRDESDDLPISRCN